MIFGPTSAEPVPCFYFGEDQVTVSSEQTYVGVTLISPKISTRKLNIFEEHYTKKASKARVIGNAIFGLESMIGVLPPWEGKKLYMALVDPHLIHGCKVSLDTNKTSLAQLEEIQVAFLRRLLGLNQRSMLAPLFTETSLVPVRFRRIILALNFLKYLLSLPTERYARRALNDSIDLAANGKPSWVKDLQTVTSGLPTPVALPNLAMITTAEIDDTIKSVLDLMKGWLKSAIDNSSKLYLLHGRKVLFKDGDTPVHKTLHFRHYLSVNNADHRKSITRLLLSGHRLALERLRWTEHRQPRIETIHRKCCFCETEIESPEHALLDCTANLSLVELRLKTMTHIYNNSPELPAIGSIESADLLRQMVSQTHTIQLLAKYTHEVLVLFDTAPMYIPALPVHWMIG